jgi:hypothetical protein
MYTILKFVAFRPVRFFFSRLTLVVLEDRSNGRYYLTKNCTRPMYSYKLGGGIEKSKNIKRAGSFMDPKPIESPCKFNQIKSLSL